MDVIIRYVSDVLTTKDLSYQGGSKSWQGQLFTPQPNSVSTRTLEGVSYHNTKAPTPTNGRVSKSLEQPSHVTGVPMLRSLFSKNPKLTLIPRISSLLIALCHLRKSSTFNNSRIYLLKSLINPIGFLCLSMSLLLFIETSMRSITGCAPMMCRSHTSNKSR